MTTLRFKTRKNDWLWSDKIFREAVADFMKVVKVDRTYDIPDLCGYSKDGMTVFVDRHAKTRYVERGLGHDVVPFWVLHEVVEKALEPFGFPYQLRHQIALHVEKEAVESAGIGWKGYNDFCDGQAKRAWSEELTRVPKTLDLTPYEDEKEYEKIKAIVAAGGR